MSIPGTLPAPLQPGHRLITVLVGVLAPLFLDAVGNNDQLAKLAALEAIEELQPISAADVLVAAVVVAFSIASLNTKLQAMQGSLAPELRLNLQTLADALHQAANRTRKALQQQARP